ncbi:MAG: hypothetical protein NTY10_06910 [Candidatus Omnitrophica bacterium]|nr:hypothetical protein [Candidatus Omnitrophota bacterium]
MKKRSGLFTGTKFLPAASLYLGENEASLSVLTRRGLFSKEEVRQEFQAETLRENLEQIADFIRTKPPAKLTIVLSHSFFLERTVFLPFRSRKSVSLVLPGELAHLLPAPLSEYFYGFVVPEAEHLPVTVFLLPAALHQSIVEVFPDVSIQIVPSDLLLSRHPVVARSENALLLVSGKTQARLFLFQKGKYSLGRSFNFGESDYRQRLAEEKGILLRSSRLPEDVEPEPVTLDERLLFGLSFPPQDFALKKGDQISRPSDISPLYFVVSGLIIFLIIFVVSLRAKNGALLSYRQVSGELAQQKELAQVGGTSLASILSDKNVTLLLQNELSPLETFSRFNEVLSKDLPLVLDYLQIDRQKLILNGTLGAPDQVDALVNKLVSSGRFNEVVLGEVKIERGIVKFPLTAKIAVKK